MNQNIVLFCAQLHVSKPTADAKVRTRFITRTRRVTVSVTGKELFTRARATAAPSRRPAASSSIRPLPTLRGDRIEINNPDDQFVKHFFLVAMATVLLVVTPGEAVYATSTPDALDPVIAAVERQFAKKSGLRFTAKTRERTFGITETETASGAYRFSGSGVRSSDVTILHQEDGSRFRLINVGRDSYTQNSQDEPLPKGKKWLSWRNARGFLWSDQLIDGVNPGFLALAASQEHRSSDGGTVDGVASTLHEGIATVAGLGTSMAGVGFDENDGASTGGEVTWRLWTGPDHLPRRFHAVIDWDGEPDEKNASFDYVKINKFYRDWGVNIKITAPSKRITISNLQR